MSYPIKFEKLRHQACMTTLTYEEVAALADLTNGITVMEKATPTHPEMGAMCEALSKKFGACALSLESMHQSDGGE